VPYTPVWFMRQAGRSLPEYRALRGDGSILEAVRRPDLAAELTLQPVRRYGVDAAILFSDIVVPYLAFGIDVTPGTGPVVEQPLAAAADLDRLRPTEAGFVGEAVRLAVRELAVPLIGFAGGPFTVASYLVEGGPSNGYARTKAFMWSDPVLWGQLMSRLSEIGHASLREQVDAGAAAVQMGGCAVPRRLPGLRVAGASSHAERLGSPSDRVRRRHRRAAGHVRRSRR
jgi:uroporphyrinogen decarboxylase